MLENRFLFWTDKLYGWVIGIGSNLQSLFLLYMRLTWGHQFFLNGYGLENFTAFIELICGILLIAGLMSRLASIPLLVVVLKSLMTTHAEHLNNFQFIFNPFSLAGTDPYPFLITTLLVLCFGPGRISIDAWIKHWLAHQPRY